MRRPGPVQDRHDRPRPSDLPIPGSPGTAARRTRAPRRRVRSAVATALAAALGLAGTGTTLTPAPAAAAPTDEAQLRTWLADTYRSLKAMTDSDTGLVADNVSGDLSTPSSYTSPTNIGGYLWSTVVARDFGLVDAEEAYQRMSTTLGTLAVIDRHDESGMYYNWYDPATGDLVQTWPDDGSQVRHFLSSVDNGWLAAALRVVAQAEPRLEAEADALYDSMNFGVYYNPDGRPDLGVGLIRGGFWDQPQPEEQCVVPGSYLGGSEVYYTCHHYDTTVSETRIALYLGITDGTIPPEAYYGTYRTFPSTCDWDWQEQRPSGVTRTYSGVPVYEGVYHYRDMAIVPGWGGSMFEALMPDMLVPESEWAPTSWGVNHPLVVRAHKEHGLDEAGYGYWGFSPASDPHGGYAEYGVDVLGLRSDGYLSDGTTDVDPGFYGCREATNPGPEFQDGVVTPHAAFLGLEYDPEGVVQNLTNIAADFDAYGPGGFYDAVAVRSGVVAQRHLSLDQSMIVAAIGNYLGDGMLRDYVVDPLMEQRLRPVLAVEVFSAAAEPTVPQVSGPVDGTTVTLLEALTGTGEPGAHLTVTAADGAWCTADVDADGDWSCAGSPVTGPGEHTFDVATINDAGYTVEGSSTTYTVVPAAPGPGDPTAEPTVPGADPGAVAGGDPAASDPVALTRNPGALALTGATMWLALLGALLATGAGTALVLARRRAGAGGTSEG